MSTVFEAFFPSERANSSYDINYEGLYEQGYRGIIYDIDNTLVEHGADADERSVELFKRLMNMGFSVCLLSNNKRERVKRFYDGLADNGVNMSRIYYIYDAKKPSRRNYRLAMKLMHTKKSTTCFIGDQLFTDVYGANRTGIKSLLVKPINKKEEIQIVVKRKFEKQVLKFYRRERWMRLRQSNIVLIGFMGSGKTSVGMELARHMGFGYIDTDELIEEQEEMCIKDIFAEKGEQYFRNLETKTLKVLLRTSKKNIICTGGGTPLREENYKLLKNLGYVIYLKASPETIIERLKDDTKRPLLQRPDREKAVKELLDQRKRVYQRLSYMTVDTDNKTIEQIIDEIEQDI